MGFLKGKTAIITGGGRSVLKDGSCGSIGYGIATAYAKESATSLLQEEINRNLPMPKRNSRNYTISKFYQSKPM